MFVILTHHYTPIYRGSLQSWRLSQLSILKKAAKHNYLLFDKYNKILAQKEIFFLGTKSNEYIIIVVGRFGFGRIKEKKKRSSSDSVQKRKKGLIIIIFLESSRRKVRKENGVWEVGKDV